MRTLRSSLVLIVLAISTVVFASGASAAPATVHLRGTVACPSGRPVVGVWVQSSGGGSGFANWSRYPGASTVAKFSRTMSTNPGTTLYLNVGCGGSTATWGSSSRTPSVKFAAGAGKTLYYNVECGSVGKCSMFPMENNTPAAPARNSLDPKQCTKRASDFWKEMTGRFHNWAGHAGSWDDNAAATGWAVRSWPRPDSLIVWQPNQAGAGSVGHVGYVSDTRVSSGKLQMKVYDRNWGGSDRNGVWVNFVSGMKFIVPPPRTAPTR